MDATDLRAIKMFANVSDEHLQFDILDQADQRERGAKEGDRRPKRLV